jgi:hypothetical protein
MGVAWPILELILICQNNLQRVCGPVGEPVVLISSSMMSLYTSAYTVLYSLIVATLLSPFVVDAFISTSMLTSIV